jgi:death-on-curing family protein
MIERLRFCGNPPISGDHWKALWTFERRACRNEGLGLLCAREAFSTGDKAGFCQVQGDDSKARAVSESPYLYLTVSQIQELHDAVIELQGGAGGAQSCEGLDSCVDAPQNVAFLKEGDVFEQASAYAYSIVRKSPFKDGNRGTALAAALVFLDINGVMNLEYDDSMLAQAMIYLADGKMDGNLFAEFLREAVSGITGTWQDESQTR